jgi:integrase
VEKSRKGRFYCLPSYAWKKVEIHTFRATGITAYLKNGGRLEIAQQMAAHESARTTGLYDRRSDEISLDEVERIVL